MKRVNNNIGGIAALVIGVIVFTWKGFIAGVKTCGGMIFSLLKSVRVFITAYLTGSDEDRKNLINSLKSTLKTSVMALAIVVGGGICITTLFDALIRTRFGFIPNFLLDAIGYLALGLLTRAIIKAAEKMSIRSDVTTKARKMVEFGMSALVPYAVISFVRYATTEGIFLILSVCIASMLYRQLNKLRAEMAAATNAVTE